MALIAPLLKKLKRGDMILVEWLDAADDDDTGWNDIKDVEANSRDVSILTICFFNHLKKSNLHIYANRGLGQDKDMVALTGQIPIGCIMDVKQLKAK